MELAEKNYEITVDANNLNTQYLKDLSHYRDLFYFLAWRDILVRYKEAFFGIAWAIIRPLLNMLMFSFLFGMIAHLPSENVDYRLFVLAGIIPWQLVTNATVDSCSSVLNNANLISKVYFPRLIIPCTQISVHLLDALIATVFLLILTIFSGELNLYSCMLLPFLFLHTIILCLGLSFWLSALTVKYRDFRFITFFLVQFSYFMCPIGYGTFLVPYKWSYLYALNPVVGIIDGFRFAFFAISHAGFIFSIISSLIISLVMFITGFFYFRSVEHTFSDKI